MQEIRLYCIIRLMQIEIRPPCPLDKFGAESVKFELSSVAVWVIVEEEGNPKYFMVVRQADEEGRPWGVPAGNENEEKDRTAKEVGSRELREETGIDIDPDEMQYLHWNWERYGAKTGQLIYGISVDIEKLDINNPKILEDGTIIFDPPESVNREEIEQLALVPLDIAFESNILNKNPYHFEPTYRGLTSLRARGLIERSFKFERDPGLGD